MEDLARIALVGTSKHAGTAAPDAEHPAEALVVQLGGDDREHVFLLRAGARAVFERCGRVATAVAAPPEPCPEESLPVAGRKLVGLLQNATASDSWDLLIEFLRQLEATGLVLPPELLPQALGASDPAVRERLLPVLGERGRWLGQLNPDWAWVTTSVWALSGRDREALVRQWDEGTFDQRRQVIETLRRSDPAEARKLVEAAIDKEKPDHRARLVESLATGLGPEDEPLLEARLEDRAEQVRRAAAALLARLSGSALAGRMQARADAMLTADAPGPKLKRLRCTPPEEIDKTWVRDGVPAKPPPGRGKRAVWTESVLAAVPPSRWSARFAAEPARLIAAAGGDDFGQAVLVGWTLAATAFARRDGPSADWLRPLWDHWAGAVGRKRGKAQAEGAEHLQALLGAMTGPEAEAALTSMLADAVTADSPIVLGLLQSAPRPWGPKFANAYLTAVRQVLKGRADNLAYQWANTLFVAGRAIPREAFDDALAPWQVAETTKAEWYNQAATREIDKFTETIRLRQRFCEEVAK